MIKIDLLGESTNQKVMLHNIKVYINFEIKTTMNMGNLFIMGLNSRILHYNFTIHLLYPFV